MTPARCLAILAALLIGAPGLAAPASGRVIWIDLCDAAHPGRHFPLPLDRDGAIRAAWPGSGHAAHALEAAHQRP